jgi:hypothetical protein
LPGDAGQDRSGGGEPHPVQLIGKGLQTVNASIASQVSAPLTVTVTPNNPEAPRLDDPVPADLQIGASRFEDPRFSNRRI